jgi:hypothetical protein
MWVIPVIATAVSLATATACGGGDNGLDAKRAIQADAQRRAEAMVLQRSDFPKEEGWEGSKSRGGPGREVFRKCIGADYSGLTIIGQADSKTFTIGPNLGASSSATVFHNEGQAEDAVKEYAGGLESAAAEHCFSDPFQKNLRKGWEVGDVSVSRLSLTVPANVADVRGWHVTVPIKETSGSGKGRQTLDYDLVLLREGQTIARLGTGSSLGGIPELRTVFIQALARRMFKAANDQ